MTAAEGTRVGQGEGVMGEILRRARRSLIVVALSTAVCLCTAVVAVQTAHAQSAGPDVQQAQTLTVVGDVGWFDSDAQTRRPAVGVQARVETPDGRLLGIATTDAEGIYRVTIPAAASIRVEISTVGNGFAIVVPAGTAHRMISQTISATGFETIEVTLNAPSTSVMNEAISVHQAIAMTAPVIEAQFGTPLDAGDIVFPIDGRSAYDVASQQLLIARDDAFDWDVILHELAHLLGRTIGIDDSPGGPHSLVENIADRLPKDSALRLAWSEGFATFFSVAVQTEANLGRLGLHFVGDAAYTDAQPSDPNGEPASFGLEDGPYGRRGAGDEAAVARALWDLYDTLDDEGDTVSVGASTLTQLASAGTTDFLSAWSTVLAGLSPDVAARAGCIASVAGAAPTPRLANPVSTGQAPEIVWDPGGLGIASPNTDFALHVLDATYAPLLAPIATGSLLSWTPTEAQWNTMSAAGVVHVQIVGRHLVAPVSEPVAGCPLRVATSIGGLDVAVRVSCLGDNGRLDVTVTNASTTARTITLVVGNLSPRTRVVAGNSEQTLTVTGRADGPILSTVFADGQIISTRTDGVSCDQVLFERPQVTLEKSCLAGNGRIDAYITNKSVDRSAAYSVFVDSVPAKTRVILPGETARVSTTGRPDGNRPVRVRRDGELVADELVAIACDVEFGNQEVVLLDSCLLGAGRFDVYLRNTTNTTQRYRVELSGLAPRDVTVRPMDAARETFTGRPDGPYDLTVRRDLVLIFNEQITISCP